MQTASMERSSRPSTPLKRYMLPETSTTRRRRLGFCWGLPSWQRNTTQLSPVEMGKPNISKDKTFQKENSMQFANQENFIQQTLFGFFAVFLSRTKNQLFFYFKPVLWQTTQLIVFPHLQWLEKKISKNSTHACQENTFSVSVLILNILFQ